MKKDTRDLPRIGVDRRNFIRTGIMSIIGSMIAPAIIPSTALGLGGRVAPSERIVMGAIGLGIMGSGNMRSFLGPSYVQMVAVCDVDGKRVENARNTVERHYEARTENGSYSGCDTYQDFRELLARYDIDAVCISTPDHWHALQSIMAVKAGKDVYCEKPLTHRIQEGRVLSDTVARYGAVLQTGSQQRSSEKFRFACELVRNERIGKLKRIHVRLPSARRIGPQPEMPVPEDFNYDMWLGPAPWSPYTKERCHYNFRFNFDYGGGQMTNFGAHNLDIAQWGNGTQYSGPVEVEGTGEFPTTGIYNVPVRYKINYKYANGVELLCDSTGFDALFEGTDGWVRVNRGRIDANPKSLLNSPILPHEEHLYESQSHRVNFLDCVRTRRQPIANAEIGHRTATMCHLGNIACLLGRKLNWNPETERFVNDPEADRLLSREYRPPWALV